MGKNPGPVRAIPARKISGLRPGRSGLRRAALGASYRSPALGRTPQPSAGASVLIWSPAGGGLDVKGALLPQRPGWGRGRGRLLRAPRLAWGQPRVTAVSRSRHRGAKVLAPFPPPSGAPSTAHDRQDPSPAPSWVGGRTGPGFAAPVTPRNPPRLPRTPRRPPPPQPGNPHELGRPSSTQGRRPGGRGRRAEPSSGLAAASILCRGRAFRGAVGRARALARKWGAGGLGRPAWAPRRRERSGWAGLSAFAGKEHAPKGTGWGWGAQRGWGGGQVWAPGRTAVPRVPSVLARGWVPSVPRVPPGGHFVLESRGHVCMSLALSLLLSPPRARAGVGVGSS